jgi:nucleotide-binding universal stress UspA family protein
MSEQVKPVVVGYDGSTESKNALDWAALHAGRTRQGLVVLFDCGTDHRRAAEKAAKKAAGTEAGSGEKPGLGERDPRRAVEVAADAVVVTAAERATTLAPGITVKTRVTHEGASSALQAASVDASLVVLGDRHHRRLAGAMLGSVSLGVSAHALCPVALVPAGSDVQPGPRHPVVVGVDGSAGGDAATRWAAELAALTRADLVLAAAWETPRVDHWSRLYLADDQWRHEEIERARHGASWHLSHARGLVTKSHPDLKVREYVEEARADSMLTKLSRKAGVVVVGARGHGDLTTLLLGSVGRSVMHRSHAPVVVVR